MTFIVYLLIWPFLTLSTSWSSNIKQGAKKLIFFVIWSSGMIITFIYCWCSLKQRVLKNDNFFLHTSSTCGSQDVLLNVIILKSSMLYKCTMLYDSFYKNWDILWSWNKILENGVVLETQNSSCGLCIDEHPKVIMENENHHTVVIGDDHCSRTVMRECISCWSYY